MSKTPENRFSDPNRSSGAPAPTLPNDPAPRGDQERPMTPDEELDEALDETFPASDPIAPSRIDGPRD